MSILNRDPKGHFMWSGQALRTWLPLLLKACSGNELIALIEGGIRFCESEAARQLQLAGQNILDPEIQKIDADNLQTDWSLKRVSRWNARRAVLVRALREMRELA